MGQVGLDQPRDRNCTFASALVPKGARRLGGLDEMIISLYAGGMTVRDIQHHLAATLGTELSHETIANVTDAVLEEVKAWQSRPLEAFYPVIYLDALVVKVRDGGHVTNRAAHLAIGPHARLLEGEQVLEDNHVALHALDFRDLDDSARSVEHPLLVDDHVNCRGNLLSDCPVRQVDAGHQDQRLHPRQGVARAV